MTLILTEAEVMFLTNLLNGATIQGADAMKVLLTILEKLKAETSG